MAMKAFALGAGRSCWVLYRPLTPDLPGPSRTCLRNRGHDSLLPWGNVLEFESCSSRSCAGSCTSPFQWALFRAMWSSMHWDSCVLEKRAHSVNRGSTTNVMKSLGETSRPSEGEIWRNSTRNTAEAHTALTPPTSLDVFTHIYISKSADTTCIISYWTHNLCHMQMHITCISLLIEQIFSLHVLGLKTSHPYAYMYRASFSAQIKNEAAILPIWIFPTEFTRLSHSGLTSSFSFFSTSPVDEITWFN